MNNQSTKERQSKIKFIKAIDMGKVETVENYLLFFPLLLDAMYKSEDGTEYNAMMRAAEKGHAEVMDILHKYEISPKYDTEAYLLALKNGHEACANKLNENGSVRVTSLHIQELIEKEETDILARVMTRQTNNIISGSKAYGLGLSPKQSVLKLENKEAETAHILSYIVRTGHGRMIQRLEEKGVPVVKALSYLTGMGKVEDLRLIQPFVSPETKAIIKAERMIELADSYRKQDQINSRKAVIVRQVAAKKKSRSL